jgi:Holliday junction resolvase RusA-like endonuclease
MKKEQSQKNNTKITSNKLSPKEKREFENYVKGVVDSLNKSVSR